MNASFSLAAILVLVAASAARAQAPSTPPIVNASPEQKSIIEKTPDGGLPLAVGVQNIEIFRATRIPEFWKDGHGWTYNHHMDMAIWKGHYLVAFTNGEKDEDVWPSHELFTHSQDGINWSGLEELFPQGVSTSLRMYFIHTSNDRMIAVAGLRTGTEKLEEAAKGGLVGREIRADLKLGDVFTLIPPPSGVAMTPRPSYETSTDSGLVTAFREVLANRMFLAQQDNGVLLGKDRTAAIPEPLGGNLKALNFFRRKDGGLVGIAKAGLTIVSTDEGKSWSRPVVPPGFITNNAKVWTQATSDGRFAMVYNPTPRDRFPLVVATSDDGITFKDMRVVHGEVPQQRYPGLNKNVGAQYIRGVSIFADDGSMKNTGGEKDMIVVYSSNKEDIWISRIPVPIRPTATSPISDHFDRPVPQGILVPDWNIYSPQWAPVRIVDVPANAGSAAGKALQLEDRDPYDYASASRVFKESAQVTLQFKLSVVPPLTVTIPGNNILEIDLTPAFGTARPIRLALTSLERLRASSGKDAPYLAGLIPGQWLNVALTIDCAAGTYSVTVAGKTTSNLAFVEPAPTLARLTIRTGPHRVLGTPVTNGQPTAPTPVDFPTDHPDDPNTFLIRDVEIK